MFIFFTFAMIFQDVQEMDENGSWHSTFQHLNIKAKSNAGSQKIGKSAENRNYNRYRDVVPYDHSLVRLRNSDTEYINANFVKVSSIRKVYILTQGPLAHTCKHFWEMVWEQNTYSIVMLNRVVEKNQLKCYQYWPLKGSMTTGDIQVTVVKEEDHHEFIVRVLELEHLKEGRKRNIHHFHYVAWPDFGVPSSPQAFLQYLLAVDEYQSSIPNAGPPVIHCSAGIGRSGTFALIDAALTEIKQADDMMGCDVKAKLLEMRTYRAGLIQTTEQFHFSYIAILEGAHTVAPEAYSTAYYSMANYEQYEEEEDEDHLDDRKRRASSEEDQQPVAKEPKKESTAVVEESSESDDGEDETVSLSDVNAQLKVEEEGREQNDDEAGDEKSGEAGDESDEEAGDKGSEEIRKTATASDNTKSEHLSFPVVTITAASSEALTDQEKEHVPDVGAEKGGTVGETKQIEDNPSFVVKKNEKIITDDGHYDDESTSSETGAKTSSRNTGSKCEQHEVNDDNTKYSESEDDFRNRIPSGYSVCSGHFSSDFNIPSSEDVISAESAADEVAGSSQSVEKVVNRWQCSDNEDTVAGERTEPRPKRSAMRRNSLEAGKRKSVTFVKGENEVQDRTSGTERDSAELVDEKETESSQVRRREVQERKRNLANKVDEIKKKMKDTEQGEDSFSTTVLGLVLCVVVAGFAYFYYRY